MMNIEFLTSHFDATRAYARTAVSTAQASIATVEQQVADRVHTMKTQYVDTTLKTYGDLFEDTKTKLVNKGSELKTTYVDTTVESARHFNFGDAKNKVVSKTSEFAGGLKEKYVNSTLTAAGDLKEKYVDSVVDRTSHFVVDNSDRFVRPYAPAVAAHLSRVFHVEEHHHDDDKKKGEEAKEAKKADDKETEEKEQHASSSIVSSVLTSSSALVSSLLPEGTVQRARDITTKTLVPAAVNVAHSATGYYNHYVPASVHDRAVATYGDVLKFATPWTPVVVQNAVVGVVETVKGVVASSMKNQQEQHEQSKEEEESADVVVAPPSTPQAGPVVDAMAVPVAAPLSTADNE